MCMTLNNVLPMIYLKLTVYVKDASVRAVETMFVPLLRIKVDVHDQFILLQLHRLSLQQAYAYCTRMYKYRYAYHSSEFT